ncbi:response regulator [Actimicrobium antarcticum]|uniref:Response regulator n=1 Tax=Actimicrobium antarcticum TaxID=1051899 RepID=A0ABP7T2P3_9BURK
MPNRTDAPLLLVEDNPDDLALSLRAFRLAGLVNPIVVARDGIDALEQLAMHRGPDLPVLVVLDLKMPRLDGIGVLKAIRADPRTCLIPVLILTSSVLSDDIRACYGVGANSYLVKPIDFAEFASTVALMTQYWLHCNALPPPAELV